MQPRENFSTALKCLESYTQIVTFFVYMFIKVTSEKQNFSFSFLLSLFYFEIKSNISVFMLNDQLYLDSKHLGFFSTTFLNVSHEVL